MWSVSSLRSVVRTVHVTDKGMAFDDEPKLPKLNNLASQCKETDRGVPSAIATSPPLA